MDFILKVKRKLRYLLFLSLIKIGLNFNSIFISKLAFGFAVKKIGDKKDIKVLCFGRSIFLDDIAAMARHSKKIQYLSIHLPYWQEVFDYFTEKSERKKLTEHNYHVSNYCQEGKRKYYLFMKRLIPELKKYFKFEAVISGNFGYIVQQEVARVCKEKNIPFFVLHKEAIVVLDSYERFVGRYKDLKFLGSKILFYNDFAKNGILKQKIDGLTPQKAKTVGVPRLDNYFYDKKQKNCDISSIKQVTFFSFYPRDSFKHMTKDENILKKIEQRSVEFHKNVMSFAEKHSEYKVVIKTKAASYFIDYVNDIYKSFNRKITNLKITNSDNATDLIKNSSVLLGFNSTIFIEGMIVNKVLISPDFGDILKNKIWSLFDQWPSLIYNIKDYNELEDILLNPSKYKISNEPEKNDFLKTYTFSSVGGACNRAEEEIIKTINYGKK